MFRIRIRIRGTHTYVFGPPEYASGFVSQRSRILKPLKSLNFSIFRASGPCHFYSDGSKSSISWTRILRIQNVNAAFCKNFKSLLILNFQFLWMRSSRVVIASDSQGLSRNCPGFDPIILWNVESEGRQIKQCWRITKNKNKKIGFYYLPWIVARLRSVFFSRERIQKWKKVKNLSAMTPESGSSNSNIVQSKRIRLSCYIILKIFPNFFLMFRSSRWILIIRRSSSISLAGTRDTMNGLRWIHQDFSQQIVIQGE